MKEEDKTDSWESQPEPEKEKIPTSKKPLNGDLDDVKLDDQASGGCNSDSEHEENDEDYADEIDHERPLEDQFPMRKTFTFDHLTISSDFDAGNMRKCIEVTNNNSKPAETPDETSTLKSKQFDIWISWDGLPYRTSGLKTWFYFYVQGASKGETVKFTVK